MLCYLLNMGLDIWTLSIDRAQIMGFDEEGNPYDIIITHKLTQELFLTKFQKNIIGNVTHSCDSTRYSKEMTHL